MYIKYVHLTIHRIRLMVNIFMNKLKILSSNNKMCFQLNKNTEIRNFLFGIFIKKIQHYY